MLALPIFCYLNFGLLKKMRHLCMHKYFLHDYSLDIPTYFQSIGMET